MYENTMILAQERMTNAIGIMSNLIIFTVIVGTALLIASIIWTVVVAVVDGMYLKWEYESQQFKLMGIVSEGAKERKQENTGGTLAIVEDNNEYYRKYLKRKINQLSCFMIVGFIGIFLQEILGALLEIVNTIVNANINDVATVISGAINTLDIKVILLLVLIYQVTRLRYKRR